MYPTISKKLQYLSNPALHNSVTQAGAISTRMTRLRALRDGILILIEVVELTTQAVIEETEIKTDIIYFQFAHEIYGLAVLPTVRPFW